MRVTLCDRLDSDSLNNTRFLRLRPAWNLPIKETCVSTSAPVARERAGRGTKPAEASDNSMSDSSPHNSGLLSVVLPCFNEQEVLPLTFARFAGMAAPFAEWNLDYELI